MRQAPETFMERHVVMSLVGVATLLVLTGMLLGQGVGNLGVHLVDAVISHIDPTE